MSLPVPLTPPDCDLQDFAFMPLHVARLRDSDLANEAHPEACWYAVLLWSAAWHQLPAASLPDNESVLAKLCGLGRDLKTFRKHRADAMRGFVKCSDGRLYHPTVAEVAVESWKRKLEQRWRTECGRIKKRNQRDKTNQPMPTFEEFMATVPETSRIGYVPSPEPYRPQGQTDPVPGTSPVRPQGNGVQETEIGTGTGTPSSEGKPSGAFGTEPEALAWSEGVRLLMERGGMAELPARKFIGKLMPTYGITAKELLPIVASAWINETRDPQGYLTKACAGIARRRDGGANQPQKRVRFV